MSKKEEALTQVNTLLQELYNSLDNTKAKDAVQLSYNRINKPYKLSQKYKEIPEAIDFLKKDFSKLSLIKENRLTRNQEEIMYELTKLTRQIFQKGFDGIMYANIWFS
jgi:DNA repair ATPase RecN